MGGLLPHTSERPLDDVCRILTLLGNQIPGLDRFLLQAPQENLTLPLTVAGRLRKHPRGEKGEHSWEGSELCLLGAQFISRMLSGVKSNQA